MSLNYYYHLNCVHKIPINIENSAGYENKDDFYHKINL